MEFRDPTGHPIGTLLSQLTSIYIPLWLGMHVFAFFSPLWTSAQFHVPSELNEVALPLLAAYGLTRKQQNGMLLNLVGKWLNNDTPAKPGKPLDPAG